MKILGLFMLATVLTNSSGFHRGQPSAEVAAVYEQLEAGQIDAACVTFIRQVRRGSADPWAYRGAANCAEHSPRYREMMLAVLRALPEETPLGLFARSIIHHHDGDPLEAERLLEECLSRAPELALAWNQRAVVVQATGDLAAAVPFLERALELAPDLELARRNLALVRVYVEARDRLAALIRYLPSHWDQLPAPRIPLSGRTVEQVLTESEDALAVAQDQILDLATTDLAEREAVIASRLAAGLQEVDLWVGFAVAQAVLTEDLDLAASICEASLQLAAFVGRRDALVFGAGICTNAILTRTHSSWLLTTLQQWHDLPRFDGSDPYQAHFSLIYAGVLARQGQSRAALAVYQKAHEALAAAGDVLGQGNALKGKADALFDLFDVRAALETYESACRLLREAGDDIGLANCFSGKGDVLRWLGRIDEALAVLREAERLSRSSHDPLGTGNALIGVAEVLHARGDFDRSIAAYLEARSSFRRADDWSGIGHTLSGEAAVRFQRGEIEAALTAYRAAAQAFRAVGSPLGLGEAVLGEASIHHHLQDVERAASAYSEAYEALRGIEAYAGMGNALIGLAELVVVHGRADDAVALYQEARSLFDAAESKLGVANAIKGEADVYLVSDQPGRALELYETARPLSRAAEDRLGLGNIHFSEAVAHAKLGDTMAARRAIAEAKAAFLEIDQDYNRTKAILWELLLLDRDTESARIQELAKQAIQLHRAWRRGYVTEHHRTEWDQSITVAYDYLIPILVRQGEVSAALTRAEEARSRALLDLLAGDALGGLEMSSETRENDREIKAQLARLENEIAEAKDKAELQTLRLKRIVLDRDLERNLHGLIASQRTEAILGQPLDAQEIQQLAEEIGPMLVFYAADTSVFGFVIAPSAELQVYSIDISWPDLEILFDEYLFQLANRPLNDTVMREARELWRRFIEPAEQWLPPSGPLTIVPHGPLHGLPFETLSDARTGKFLFQRWDVAVSPSVSALRIAREHHQPPRPDDDLVVLAAGVGLSISAAPSVIQDLFTTSDHPLEPEAGTFGFYETVASKARHLLITTHGVHSQGDRRGTFLEIRPSPGVHDRRLTSAEIAAIPLNAELVTLSACDTDYGDALFSDDRLTLSRSFLIAEAASVLATRWRVPDGPSTNRFLLDFYQAYRRGADGDGMRKDQALTRSRQKAIERGELPGLWAAWVLVGDARR